MFDMEFRKSTYSANAQACVEVATPARAGAAIRDTKHRDLGALSFPSPEWQAFLSTAQSDQP
ncbi:DUF397 domain-containing protein [Nocardiopsis tropica]|uniref:DUF397 domain-containing protein n=2 Tax=Nocardiopsis tropica TaxID=109330 RepID=A0ABU7KUP8_9ACTN|nr:DUF397 domain-containing protein [Nocardiopsis umidischolae]